MRILLITNDWLPKKGGITTYLSSLVDSVGHEFTIYAPSWAKGANLINSSASFFLNGKDTVKEITDIVYNEKIDIILHGSSNPQFLLVNKLDQILNTENPKSIKIPQFMICHGAEFNILNYIPVVRTLLKRNLNKLNKVFTVSEFSKKKLQDITETDIVNISAGVVIPPTKKEFETEKALKVGVMSRFVSRKKIDWVIDAVHELKENGHDVELDILGFGKQKNYLQRLSLLSSAKVNFIDEQVDEEYNFYENIDIFVMPSKSKYFGVEFEGLGLVYLEAASYGIPTLVGASGGSPETIIPGQSGFVVGDKKAVVDGILYFIQNPKELEIFGERNKENILENFSLDVFAQRFESEII
jgi:phosphatidylinositol alpha-1,6-mannosyltransferase